MTRAVRIIFCDNEHGTGDQTFPEIAALTSQDFVEPKSLLVLRREAKKAGWSRHAGGDYCPSCTESL